MQTPRKHIILVSNLTCEKIGTLDENRLDTNNFSVGKIVESTVLLKAARLRIAARRYVQTSVYIHTKVGMLKQSNLGTRIQRNL